MGGGIKKAPYDLIHIMAALCCIGPARVLISVACEGAQPIGLQQSGMEAVPVKLRSR